MNLQSLARQGQDVLHNAGRAVATAAKSSIARRLLLTMALGASLAGIADSAFAALPSPAPAPGATTSGDYIGLIREYWKQGVAVMVLIVGAMAFLSVGGGAVAKFNDFRNGKAEVGDLIIYAVLGVVVLVIVVYLLTSSQGIM